MKHFEVVVERTEVVHDTYLVEAESADEAEELMQTTSFFDAPYPPHVIELVDTDAWDGDEEVYSVAEYEPYEPA